MDELRVNYDVCIKMLFVIDVFCKVSLSRVGVLSNSKAKEMYFVEHRMLAKC